jgi:hypothetical protein
MIELVKAAGREVEQRAEDLVGDIDGMWDMDIWLRFPEDGLPRIDVNRSLASKECFDVLIGMNKKD